MSNRTLFNSTNNSTVPALVEAFILKQKNVYLHNNAWNACKSECKSIIAFDLVLFAFHFLVNLWWLKRWAQWNLYLIFLTLYSAMLSVYSSLLARGNPKVMWMKQAGRYFWFSCSLLTNIGFFSVLIGYFQNLHKGKKQPSSKYQMQSALFLYSLVLQTSAWVPSLYIFQYEVKK